MPRPAEKPRREDDGREQQPARGGQRKIDEGVFQWLGSIGGLTRQSVGVSASAAGPPWLPMEVLPGGSRTTRLLCGRWQRLQLHLPFLRPVNRRATTALEPRRPCLPPSTASNRSAPHPTQRKVPTFVGILDCLCWGANRREWPGETVRINAAVRLTVRPAMMAFPLPVRQRRGWVGTFVKLL